LADSPTGKSLFVISLSLLAIGVVTVYSASDNLVSAMGAYARTDVRHMVFAALAALILGFGWLFDYHCLAGNSDERNLRLRRDGGFPIPAALLLGLAAVLAALVFIPGIGYQVGGKARWIRLGPSKYRIGFQPSELLKLSLIIFLAAWLAHRRDGVRSFRRTVLPAGCLICLCAALVVTEDFGTAAIIAVSGVGMLFLAGVPWRYMLAMAVAGGGGLVVFLLHSPYRLNRIVAFLDPWSTSNPAAYQPRQSLLSVVSGGYLGKGLGLGMIKRGFLPEGPTDFIFATFCEECGLVGAALLLALMLAWLWQARKAALNADDQFGRLLCGGLGLLIGLQMVLHVAVDLVVAPPTGIGLPFVSAGGTALLTASAAAALMISVTVHRQRRGTVD